MSTWVIGDVHGCHKELKRLFAQLDFDHDRDALWMTGDLVNRGPRSAEVLRWCRKREAALGVRFQCVVGNHDLHAIALHLKVGRRRSQDTLTDLLAAEDRDELFDWLLRRPFLVQRQGTLLVHAGVLPDWTPEHAEQIAVQLHHRLVGDPVGFIKGKMSPAKREAVGALTRMRTLDEKGRQDGYSGSLEDLPKRLTPWFRVAGRRTAYTPIVCGHWAAIGLHREANVTTLDTGCAWGGALTALRLEDGAVIQEPSSC